MAFIVNFLSHGEVAQLAEQRTHKPLLCFFIKMSQNSLQTAEFVQFYIMSFKNVQKRIIFARLVCKIFCY